MRGLFCFLLVAISCHSWGQKLSKVEVLNADVFEFVKIGDEQIKKLKGNCSIKQDNMLLFCDSALVYELRNAVDAYGRVHIKQGDSLNLYGDKLTYDGNTKIAKFNGNVKVLHNQMVLNTGILTYDTKNRIATYPQYGTITDGENKLNSRTGYYYANTADAYFKKEVTLINPKYILNSDTLKYNSKTKVATFLGPTTIVSSNDNLYAEAGTYNTITDIAQFTKNPIYKSKSQILTGDYLYYDRAKGIGRGTNNVTFTDTLQKMIVKGNKVNYNRLTDLVTASNKAYVIVLVDNDSLFVSADTLRSYLDKEKKYRTIVAYYDVRAFKADIQARSDSMSFSYLDSTLRCYEKPIIWSQNAQMTAEFVTLEMKNGVLDKMNLYNAAFLAMVDSVDSSKHDQVRGKNMFGQFYNNELVTLLVEGNGQSIYYAKEENGYYLGVNKADCSNMFIRFKDNKVNKVSFMTRPDAVFSPLDQVNKEDLKLKGFSWRIREKPLTKYDVINRN